MKKVRMVIEVEGNPQRGQTAPIYSLDVVRAQLFEHLASNGWTVRRYGDDYGKRGACWCYPNHDEQDLEALLEQHQRTADVEQSMRG